jgi:hypothetical protein
VGEAQSTLFALDFNRSIHVEARPERLTGDAGSVLLREVFSRLDLDRFFEERLIDPRRPELILHPQIELLRTEVLLLAQGWQDQDDADRLRQDPALRLAVSQRCGVAPLQTPPETARVPEGLASQPTLSRLAATLSTEQQRRVLREGLLKAAARRLRATRGRRLRHATLDVDSLPVEVYGTQAGSAYNGYYGVRCYHPLVAAVGETGDLLDVRLREGNAHTADGALEFVLPLLDRMEREFCQVASVRMDAGFPEDELLSALEQRQVGYVARLRSNSRLAELAAPLLRAFQPEQPQICFHELSYQAESWSCARRVVLVLQQEPGELFAHSFFLLTNWSAEDQPPVALLALYRQRGTAEGHLGELMNVLEPALSSTRRAKSHYRGESPKRRYASRDPFATNEVKLLLNALAYNLVHAVRILMEKVTGEGWGLKRVVERLLKVPARLLLHSRRVLLILNPAIAGLWATLWSALGRWRWLPPPSPA